MTGKMKSTIVTLMLVGIVLGVNWGCPKSPEPPVKPQVNAPSTEGSIEPTEIFDIEIGVIQKGMVVEDIRKVRVERGQAVRIRSTGSHAYVLIPDGGLELFDTGKNVCEQTDAWIACRVDQGSGIGVYVPIGYRPDLLEKEHTIWYSVLFRIGEKYDYQHGEKKSSPPEFIIPPGLPN